MTNNAEEAVQSGAERRRFERKPLTVEIEFAGGTLTGTAMTREIGLGGLYMATPADLPVNAQLKLKLRLGDTDLELDGIVTYKDAGSGVGIRFHNASDQAQTILKRELPAIETADVSVKRR